MSSCVAGYVFGAVVFYVAWCRAWRRSGHIEKGEGGLTAAFGLIAASLWFLSLPLLAVLSATYLIGRWIESDPDAD